MQGTFMYVTLSHMKPKSQYFLPVIFIWSLVHAITTTILTKHLFLGNQVKTKVMVAL